MMIVTLQTRGTLKPSLSVHGDTIKVDLGVLLIEGDTQGFKDMITDLIVQAAAFGINIPSYR
jgi:hypothetical protein